MTLLALIGLCAVAGGAVGLAREMTRPPTNAETQAAAAAEVSSRWERLPAGQIFPARLNYVDSANSPLHVDRVGIAPRATCAQAAEPPVARTLTQAGCVTVLRATYVDSTGVLVATVGIAVMPSSAAAEQAAAIIGTGDAAGIHAVRLPGTVASAFGDAQRQYLHAIYPGTGPYVYFDAVGFTDGRVQAPGTTEQSLSDLGNDVPADLAAIMTQRGPACRAKDIQC